MPCYNSAAYIRSAVESLKGQTYRQWELIAVNDGSKDDTLSILETYAKDDDRIRIFSKENGGYVSAVNMGLDNISGDYFLLMGSDDRLSYDLFEKINEVAIDKMPDVIGFRTLRFVDGENKGVDKFTSFSTFVNIKDSDILRFEKSYPEHSEIMFTRDTSKIFKTELLGDLRYFGKYGFDADGIFTMLFSHKARSFMSVPVDGYNWTLRSDSLSGRPLTNEITIDRISDWYLFFEQLGEYDNTLITNHEKKYISYYFNTVRELYEKIGCKDKNVRELVGKCIQQLKKIIKKYEYQKIIGRLSFGQRLFLLSPSVYIFFTKLKKNKKHI